MAALPSATTADTNLDAVEKGVGVLECSLYVSIKLTEVNGKHQADIADKVEEDESGDEEEVTGTGTGATSCPHS